MPRGPRLTPEMRRLLTTLYVERPDVSAKELRNRFRALIERTYPDFARLHSKFPSVSTIEKFKWKDLKTQSFHTGPEDAYWTTAALAKYPVPPEALQAVLDAWMLAQQEEASLADVEQVLMSGEPPGIERRWSPLTIRQAKWVAQLSHVIQNRTMLLEEARRYSAEERALAVVPFTGSIRDVVSHGLQDLHLYNLSRELRSAGG